MRSRSVVHDDKVSRGWISSHHWERNGIKCGKLPCRFPRRMGEPVYRVISLAPPLKTSCRSLALARQLPARLVELDYTADTFEKQTPNPRRKKNSGKIIILDLAKDAKVWPREGPSNYRNFYIREEKISISPWSGIKPHNLERGTDTGIWCMVWLSLKSHPKLLNGIRIISYWSRQISTLYTCTWIRYVL